MMKTLLLLQFLCSFFYPSLNYYLSYVIFFYCLS